MRNILIIDDEESILLLITMALARFDFNVEIAADGIEGIKKFDEDCFDLVITDMRMPGLNGHGVLQHVRNSAKQFTPVVGISGTPWIFENADFDAVLQKPFTIKALIETTNNLTEAGLCSIAN